MTERHFHITFCFCNIWTSVKQRVMCSEVRIKLTAHIHQYSEKGWHFQSKHFLIMTWQWIFTLRQLLPFQRHFCEAEAEEERARQTPLIQRHLTAPATWSKAKLRQKVSTHEHTKPALVSCYRIVVTGTDTWWSLLVRCHGNCRARRKWGGSRT